MRDPPNLPSILGATLAKPQDWSPGKSLTHTHTEKKGPKFAGRLYNCTGTQSKTFLHRWAGECLLLDFRACVGLWVCGNRSRSMGNALITLPVPPFRQPFRLIVLRCQWLRLPVGGHGMVTKTPERFLFLFTLSEKEWRWASGGDSCPMFILVCFMFQKEKSYRHATDDTTQALFSSQNFLALATVALSFVFDN